MMYSTIKVSSPHFLYYYYGLKPLEWLLEELELSRAHTPCAQNYKPRPLVSAFLKIAG
jgi:hypothetical protein